MAEQERGLTIKDLWLLKRRRPDSVLASALNREDVQRQADDLNRNEQTDNYYVEQYDTEKVYWPASKN